jgi:hypothetical protein
MPLGVSLTSERTRQRPITVESQRRGSSMTSGGRSPYGVNRSSAYGRHSCSGTSASRDATRMIEPGRGQLSRQPSTAQCWRPRNRVTCSRHSGTPQRRPQSAILDLTGLVRDDSCKTCLPSTLTLLY